jgi:hypothetical protein
VVRVLFAVGRGVKEADNAGESDSFQSLNLGGLGPWVPGGISGGCRMGQNGVARFCSAELG